VILHVAAGDTTAEALLRAGLPGEVAVYRDLLIEGPLPEGDDAAFVLGRAEFWASTRPDLKTPAENEAALLADDQALLRPAAETVLWFGRDVACRVAVARLLDLYPRRAPAQRLSLARCPDSALCFGEVGADVFEPTFAARQPVAVEHLAAARQAWDAFRAPSPLPLWTLAHAPPAPLSAFGEAAAILLRGLPDSHTLLRPFEARILEALGEKDQPIWALYEPARAVEPLRGLTDESFLRLMRGLSEGKDPLVQTGRNVFRDDLKITDRGRRVLAGEPWVRPDVSRWRWDRQRRAPVLA
jgi:hypothetical protein